MVVSQFYFSPEKVLSVILESWRTLPSWYCFLQVAYNKIFIIIYLQSYMFYLASLLAKKLTDQFHDLGLGSCESKHREHHIITRATYKFVSFFNRFTAEGNSTRRFDFNTLKKYHIIYVFTYLHFILTMSLGLEIFLDIHL